MQEAEARGFLQLQGYPELDIEYQARRSYLGRACVVKQRTKENTKLKVHGLIGIRARLKTLPIPKQTVIQPRACSVNTA